VAHFKLKAYSAERVIVGIRNATLRKKIFQINFTKNGSLFVSIPYAKLGVGRVSVVECPPGNPESLDFGDSAPVTTHAVKYSHHPDGEAHFSQDGKVFTRIRRKAVPLIAAEGHLFTLVIQGLHRFDDVAQKDVATAKRGIVLMPISDGPLEALKFVGHLFSSSYFARHLLKTEMDSPFIPVIRPDGQRLVSIVLATKLMEKNRPYLLVVTVERIGTIATYSDFTVQLMGGFDHPDVAFDQSRPTSFLIMMYPELRDINDLISSVGR